MTKYKNCQSCGIPLKKDPQGGSKNADGSKNEMYCSYCYRNGAFTQPNFTVTEMQLFCKAKLKDMGFPGFLAGLFTKGIPNLERWKSHQ
ncbi:zinc ribbon domain-containing protein [Chondrinema litorale]|uniref:zinc ribbon domain-containing protein n=1 Tax=Chondrinema litorale TaxID=2994555 RepID=UPI002542C4B8|nr:zinc ribbon domain-containing protein [Chondrinema litorale]UZR96980.1 zinc ribbon domain-containing protein [Chondrinema litorale]